MKRRNTLWLILIACALAGSCEPVFERGREIYRREAARNLEGSWYVNGDRDKRAEITSTSAGLEARNERGQTSRLERDRDGDVRALDWEGGLRGDVRSDRIEWANGTFWAREPSSRGR